MEVTLTQTLLVTLWAFIIGIDQFNILLHIHRPLVTGLVVGWILGDVPTGLITGATLELVAMGMVPLALGLGEGAEQRAPMGQAVIGGTITSTLLTLVVVPVVYTYLDDFGVKVKKWFAKDTEHKHPTK